MNYDFCKSRNSLIGWLGYPDWLKGRGAPLYLNINSSGQEAHCLVLSGNNSTLKGWLIPAAMWLLNPNNCGLYPPPRRNYEIHSLD